MGGRAESRWNSPGAARRATSHGNTKSARMQNKSHVFSHLHVRLYFIGTPKVAASIPLRNVKKRPNQKCVVT
jgi:hypothetical protein